MKKFVYLLFCLLLLVGCEKESVESTTVFHDLYQTKWEGKIIYPEGSSQANDSISIFFFTDKLSVITLSGERYINFEYQLFENRLKLSLNQIKAGLPNDWLIVKHTKNVLKLESWTDPSKEVYRIEMRSN